MKTIWLTRPKEDSEALAAELAMPAIVAPVVRIVPRPVTNFGDMPEGIILTSRHALPMNIPPAGWRALPIYCVGESTAAAAHEAGFTTIIEGGGDALLLAARIADSVAPGSKMLYFSGEETRADLPAVLGASDISVRAIVTYDAAPETSLPAALSDAIKQHTVGAVVFFSARSAEYAAALLSEADLASHAAEMDAFCLSTAVANAARTLPWRSRKVAARPSLAAMVELVRTSAI